MKLLVPITLSLICGAAAFAEVTVQRDIPYLGAERAEKLDVYLPSPGARRPLPAVLLIHGGGWEVGDKASARERNIGQTLAEKGYAVFSINYLLNLKENGPDGKPRLTRLAWPQNLIDCKTALRFMRAEAERFAIDPARIAVMGGSAGGHLAMLVGVGRKTEAFAGTLYPGQRDDVACIINLYGPSDIRGRGVSPFANSTLGKAEKLAGETDASPILYLDADTPPMLILHGTADKVIPVERSRELVLKLQALGVEHQYVEIPGAPHTFDLQPEQMDLRPLLLTFLARHLGALQTPASGVR
ncbi:MAG: alpha/beta hydrolase [Opitutaceae bacterium]|nr:alpha/beta hydrolase [Opitutaceae bacterium]